MLRLRPKAPRTRAEAEFSENMKAAMRRVKTIGLIMGIAAMIIAFAATRNKPHDLHSRAEYKDGEIVKIYECRVFTILGNENKPAIKDEITGEYHC